MFQSAVESHSSGLQLTFQGASLTPDLFFQRSGSQPWTENSFICISSEFYVRCWHLIVSKLVVLFSNSSIIFQQLSSEGNNFPLRGSGVTDTCRPACRPSGGLWWVVNVAPGDRLRCRSPVGSLTFLRLHISRQSAASQEFDFITTLDSADLSDTDHFFPSLAWSDIEY